MKTLDQPVSAKSSLPEYTPGAPRRHSSSTAAAEAISVHLAAALALTLAPTRIITPGTHSLPRRSLTHSLRKKKTSTRTWRSFLSCLLENSTREHKINFHTRRAPRRGERHTGAASSPLRHVAADKVSFQRREEGGRRGGTKSQSLQRQTYTFSTPRVLPPTDRAAAAALRRALCREGGRWAGSGWRWAGLWVGCARGGKRDHSTSHLRASNSCPLDHHHHHHSTSALKVVLNEIIKWRRR